MGTGHVALLLRTAGVYVDGIELSPHMVDRMREKPLMARIAGLQLRDRWGG